MAPCVDASWALYLAGMQVILINMSRGPRSAEFRSLIPMTASIGLENDNGVKQKQAANTLLVLKLIGFTGFEKQLLG